ncbi:MAG TPA: ATP-binding protein [Streptomyces sp.]|uniref:ATP-binding protein n=1 Tax=Streptomyces sp. TaxID=1931 RepID=UPI002D6E793C|nr:ATP-binding protein [Streptomyces sp.]HZG04570.1 ATP-binding protein [Streptomyces sp.]
MEIRGETFPDPVGRAPVAAPGRPAARPALRPQPYEGTWRFTAPVRESSVPQARHAVRDLIRRRGAPVPDDLLYGLLLIVSELVTNAVRHAALLSTEIGVEVSIGGGWVRIGVEDGHPYRPSALAADPAQEHTGGRGLLLVKATVAEAGGSCEVQRTASGGKVVRAALPLPPLPAR